MLCFVLIPVLGNAQSKIEYFPQEQLMHPNLSGDEDPNVYLHALVERKLVAFLSEKPQLNALKKIKKDTLSMTLGFSVNPKGKVILQENGFNSNKHKYLDLWNKDIKEILSSLPKFEVKNRKPEPWVSMHFLRYRFVYHKKPDPAVESIPSLGSYSGGVIQEIPIFPGCENLNPDETSQCFQLMMENHISTNFIYPSDALAQRASGTVVVVMDISEEGKIENLRVRGKSPHGSLRREAYRIINALPQLQPGKRNGEVDTFTYSIPVIFQL